MRFTHTGCPKIELPVRLFKIRPKNVPCQFSRDERTNGRFPDEKRTRHTLYLYNGPEEIQKESLDRSLDLSRVRVKSAMHRGVHLIILS